MRIVPWIAIWMLLSGAALAQTMVESATLASAGATAAAKSAKITSNAVMNALGNLSKTVAAPAPTAKAVTLPAAKVPEIRPARPERDTLLAVKEGTLRAELVAKAGQPSFAITSPKDGRLVEVLDYTTKDGASARVRLSDGKVASVEWPESK